MLLHTFSDGYETFQLQVVQISVFVLLIENVVFANILHECISLLARRLFILQLCSWALEFAIHLSWPHCWCYQLRTPPPNSPPQLTPQPPPSPFPPPTHELSVSLAARRAKRFCVFNCLWRALFNGTAKQREERRESWESGRRMEEESGRRIERQNKSSAERQKETPDPGNPWAGRWKKKKNGGKRNIGKVHLIKRIPSQNPFTKYFLYKKR